MSHVLHVGGEPRRPTGLPQLMFRATVAQDNPEKGTSRFLVD
jgi:hypothetical protein